MQLKWTFLRRSIKSLWLTFLTAIIIVYLSLGVTFATFSMYCLLLTSKYAGLSFWIIFGVLLILLARIIKKQMRINRSVKVGSDKSISLTLIIWILIFIWIALQASLAIYIEAEYFAIRDHYKRLFTYYLKSREDRDVLTAAWNITLLLRQDFKGTYGYNVFLPSRYVSSYIGLFFSPLLSLCYWGRGIDRLVVVQRMGACWEFATAVATLLSDAAGLHTRRVCFEGIDHALPEVYLRGKWWVFDAYYTTPNRPIKAKTYASYLRSERGGLDKFVSRMLVANTGLNVLREHGFNSSMLVITAIIDLTTNPLDDIPAGHAIVEIFALENRYDPLVATGYTDERGYYSVQLNGGKEYIIVIKHGGRIGLAKVYLPPNSCIAIEVRLHKYE